MLESFIGFILILASGLIGKEVLLKEQPSLRITLHHLEAYRDILGLCALLTGILGLYHGISTSLSHTYTPVYWLTWTSSNFIALVVGLSLCLEMISSRIKKLSLQLYRLCQVSKLLVDASPKPWCWLGLTLGTWRALWPWLGY
ncbi:MAG: hypothetical protein CMH49_05825 [Myxococcales bacterium]|nr:hypothetical protein [Myxococcales bacterium]